MTDDRGKFDKKLIEELVKYTGRSCVITGSETFQIAHLEHRGQGGDPTKNVVENLIPLRKDWHDLYDGRIHQLKWNGMTITDIRFDKWEPKQGNLEISVWSNGSWKSIDKSDLWFYKRPTQVKAEEAWQHHQMVLEGKKDTVMGIIKMGAGLTPIKHNEEWRDMGYTSWRNYCNSPEVSVSMRTANRAIHIYDGLVEGLDIEPDRLAGIDQVKLEEITKVVNEDNKEQWLAEAKELSREDVRKRVREVKGESLNVSCSNCARPVFFEFDRDFDQISFGSRNFSYCPVKPSENKGYLVETHTPQEQREIAENCEMYQEE